MPNLKELLTKISEELTEFFIDYEEFEKSYAIIPLKISDYEVNKIKESNLWIGFHLKNYDKRMIYKFLTNSDIALLMPESEDFYRRKFLYGVVLTTMKLFERFESKYETSLDNVILVAEIFEANTEILKSVGTIELANIRSNWSFI